MSTNIRPLGRIILTNELGLIGAGYDYQLTSGPDGSTEFNTGSFGISSQTAGEKKVRFDHCFTIDPESPVAWTPFPEDLVGFFTVTLIRKSDGVTVSDRPYDFHGDPRYTFQNMVHYTLSHHHVYDAIVPEADFPDGEYELRVSARPDVVDCLPAIFPLGKQGENIWMSGAPHNPALLMLPLVEGRVTREELNPAAPAPPAS